MKHILFVLLAACAPPPPHADHPASSSEPERAFLHDNDRAMARMMDAMMIHPRGDIDADFVAMMSPHHRGAVDMALLELRYGHNERLRRLAQEIIVTQEDEIRAMAVAIGDAK